MHCLKSHYRHAIALLALGACNGESPFVGGPELTEDGGAGNDASLLPPDGALPSPDASSSPPDGGSPADGGGTPPKYAVYPGCESPATTFGASVFVDPTNGVDGPGRGNSAAPYKTFAYVVANRALQGGERVVFLAGDHGDISLAPFNSPQLVGAARWTWLEFAAGARASSVAVRKMSRILITGATVEGMSTGSLLSATGSSEVVIADNHVSSSPIAPTTIQGWMSLPNGIDISQSHCASVLRNKLKHLRHGFSVSFAGLDYPANIGRDLLEENELQGFSGDGARMNASELVIRKNRFVDGYVSVADGDANHDDMIQGFKPEGGWYQDISIEDNFFADRATPGRGLISDYQGVGIFDGVFKRLTVRRNVILTGAYHGIGLYGVVDSTIENNTVIATSTNSLWIRIEVGKMGERPSNVTVKNNLVTELVPANIAANVNNFKVSSPQTEFLQFDPANGVYDMHLRPASQFSGRGVGAY